MAEDTPQQQELTTADIYGPEASVQQEVQDSTGYAEEEKQSPRRSSPSPKQPDTKDTEPASSTGDDAWDETPSQDSTGYHAEYYDNHPPVHELPPEGPKGIAVKRSAFIDGIGKYIAPEENTLANHYGLVLGQDNGLFFNPSDYPLDTVAAYVFKDPAFSNEPHPHFLDYEPLRDNVAVVRNFILQNITENSDLNDRETLVSACNALDYMGYEIGRALQRGTWVVPQADALNPLKTSQPGTGAAEIYSLLLRKQESNKFLHFAKKLAGRDYSNWNLPPISETPFSPEQVQSFLQDAAAPKAPSTPAVPEPLPAEPLSEPHPVLNPVTNAMQPVRLDGGRQLSVLGSTLAGTALSLERVRRLPKPVRDESVAIARDILDKLRFTLGEAAPRGEWAQRPEEQVLEESNALVSVANCYADIYNNAQAVNPASATDEELLKSNEALGKLAYLVKESSIRQLEVQGNTKDAALLRQELAHYPEEWRQLDGVNMGGLLAQLNAGLDRAEALIAQAWAEGVNPPAEALHAQTGEHNSVQNPAVLAATLNAQILQQLQQQERPKLNAQQIASLPSGLQGLTPKSLAALQNVQGKAASSTRLATVQEAVNVTGSAGHQSHVEALGRHANASPPTKPSMPAEDYRKSVLAQQNPAVQEKDTVKTR